MAWDCTSLWPTGEFEEVKGAQKPISDRTEEYAEELWNEARIPEEDQRYDEHGLQKLMEKVKETDPDIFDADAPIKNNAMKSTSEILTKALEVAIVLHDRGITLEEELPDTEQVLRWISKRLHTSGHLSSIVKSSRAWGVLQDGALAKVVGVNEDEINKFAATVMETFTMRFSLTPSNPGLERESISELLKMISDNTVNNEGAWADYDESELQEHPTTVLRNPLNNFQTSDLEDRLHISLPEDYKEFLSCINSLESAWGGLMMDPPLSSAQDVDWLENKNESLAKIPIELLDILVFHINHRLIVDEWPQIGRAVEIGSEDVYLVWMLTPDGVKCVRDEYRLMGNGDEKIKAAVDTGIRSFYGPEQEFEKLGWCTVTWDASGLAMEA